MIIKIDLHVHTKYSRDSLIEPKKLPKIIKAKRLHGVAITDHESIFPSKLLLKMKDVIIIPGIEVSTPLGEIIGLFVSEKVKTDGLDETLDYIKNQGGLAILPHPYGFPRLKRRRLLISNESLIKRIDAIEVYNSRNISSKYNLMALQLAQSLGKPIVAGSDAHFHFEIGNAYTIFENAYSPEDVYHKIKAGETNIYCKQTFPLVHLMTMITKLSRKIIYKKTNRIDV